jgi:hypothetical protein
MDIGDLRQLHVFRQNGVQECVEEHFACVQALEVFQLAG